MRKKIFLFTFLVSILVPGFCCAQTRNLSVEEKNTDEQIQNIEDVQNNQPEGAGVVLGEADLDLPEAKSLPGDFSYSLQRFWEIIVSAFTFKKISKVDYALGLSQKRLSETEKLLHNKKWQKAKYTIRQYREQISIASKNFQDIEKTEKDQIDVRSNQKILDYIAALSVFSENQDYGKVKKELNHGLDQTLEFQKKFGL